MISEAHFLNILDCNLEYVRDNGVEYVYLCPFCNSIKGSPDTKGHLFFNIITQLGYCFRHSSSVSIYDITTDINKYMVSGRSVVSMQDKLKLNSNFTIMKSKIAFKEFKDNFEPIQLDNTKDIYLNYLLKRVKGSSSYNFFYKSKPNCHYKYSNRVAVGWYDVEDNFHYVARSILDNISYRYINSKTVTDHTMYESKRINLLNSTVLENSIDIRSNIIILVEGVFDAISVGYPVRAILGKKLKKRHIEYLLNSKFINFSTEIVLFLDNDTDSDIYKMYRELSMYFSHISKAECLPGKDPGDMNMYEIKDAISNRRY